eukprot:scaffold2699_cov140-Skeletonema_marinoi.AAC.9
MSSDNDEIDDAKMMSCASCGIVECDEIKLKNCTNCDLVRYCGDECQENHATQHEEACKNRATELRDELLFRQPESSYLGDCPICMLPMQLDLSKATVTACCSKLFCNGCAHANYLREGEGGFKYTCPFCREVSPTTKEESDKQRMKRIEANDPVAMRQEGIDQGKNEYCSKAAELGDAKAHYRVALMYWKGCGVEKDRGKEMYHTEEATIGGHPSARCYLGCVEWNNDNTERAVKHWIIAATQGHDDSIDLLMNAFKKGMVSKEDLAAALRAHQAAVDATKSPQREAAEEYCRSLASVVGT